jgi:hypothetical protein
MSHQQESCHCAVDEAAAAEPAEAAGSTVKGAVAEAGSVLTGKELELGIARIPAQLRGVCPSHVH